ncbi:hypothetical protein B0H14DRAFT_2593492 [Mycena olivaceomarginata]|nr:hypothetical protein B0H14DRAFT_2593492 [Mycena olivaceomarginata]
MWGHFGGVHSASAPLPLWEEPTATIISAARHLSSKPEDGKQSRVLDKQGHSVELSPSTSTTSFTSRSTRCSGTLAMTFWTSTSTLAPLKLRECSLWDAAHEWKGPRGPPSRYVAPPKNYPDIRPPAIRATHGVRLHRALLANCTVPSRSAASSTASLLSY